MDARAEAALAAGFGLAAALETVASFLPLVYLAMLVVPSGAERLRAEKEES